MLLHNHAISGRAQENGRDVYQGKSVVRAFMDNSYFPLLEIVHLSICPLIHPSTHPASSQQPYIYILCLTLRELQRSQLGRWQSNSDFKINISKTHVASF
jgi:hypothetical protein